MSSKALKKWLADELRACGMSQAEFGRRMGRILGREVGRDIVNKILSPTNRQIRADELLAIEQALNVKAPRQIDTGKLYERMQAPAPTAPAPAAPAPVPAIVRPLVDALVTILGSDMEPVAKNSAALSIAMQIAKSLD